MRLISFLRSDGTASYGTTDGTRLWDAGAELSGTYADLRAVLTADATGELDGVGAEMSLQDVTLLPPITNPDKILCIGLNYTAHIKETGREKPNYPTIFVRHPSSLVGHGSPLVRPKASVDFDYEGELAVVIGKSGRHISKADAMSHIAGFSCFNDGTIRDFQSHTTQFWPGKSFESSGAMGPWLVTADEVGDITTKALTTRVNGNVEQSSTISDLAFTIPDLIAYASTVATLLPGDVIATGTPGGVGKFRQPQLYLAPGMSVEIEVEDVGTLSNGVVDEA